MDLVMNMNVCYVMLFDKVNTEFSLYELRTSELHG